MMKLAELLNERTVAELKELKSVASPFADVEAIFLASEVVNSAVEAKTTKEIVVAEEVAVEAVKTTVVAKAIKNTKTKTRKVKVKVMKNIRNEERITKFFEMIERMATRSVVIDAAQKQAKKLFGAVPYEFFISSLEVLANAKKEYKPMEGFVMKYKEIKRASFMDAAELGIKNISSVNQLAKAFNAILYGGDTPYFNKVNVVGALDENGNGQTTVNAAPATNSRFSTSFKYRKGNRQIDLDGYKVLTGEGTTNYVTTDIIYVSCRDCGNDMVTYIDQIRKYGLYRFKGDIYFPSYVNNQLELRANSPQGAVTPFFVDAAGRLRLMTNDILTHYTFFNASPAQERNGDFMCIDETKYGLNSDMAKSTGVDKFTLLDNMLGGALSYWVAKNNMDTSKALKIGTRLALHNTGSVELGKVGNDKYGVLYILNPISGDTDFDDEAEKVLDEVGVKIDDNILDGQAWILSDVITDSAEAAGIKVNPQAIIGAGLQARLEGLNDKSFALSVTKKVMDVLAKNLIKANPYKLEKGEPTNQPGYVIIGNPDNIGYIVDDNSAKLPNMWRCYKDQAAEHGVEYGNFMVNILAIANDSKSKSSIQAIGKIFNEAVEESLKTNYHNMLVDSLDRIVKGAVSASGKCTLVEKLFAANPEKSLKSHITHSMLLQELSDQGMSAIRKMKVPVEGMNTRAFFDNTFLLTGDFQSTLKVLDGGVVQAYSKSAVKNHRRELKAIQKEYLAEIASIDAKLDAQEISVIDAHTQKAIAKAARKSKVDAILNSYTIKYPCPTDIEFAKFRFMADFEIIEAVDALDADDNIKQLIKDFYLGLGDGITMIAPLNILKHKLAGMDTDFDGITSFFEKSIVEAAFAKDINDIIYIDKKGEKSIYNPDYKAAENNTTVENTDSNNADAEMEW